MGELDDLRRRSQELRARAERARTSLLELPRDASAAQLSTVDDAAQLLDDVQEKLAKSEILLAAIFDGALDGFVLTDAEFRFLDLNAAAAAIYGEPREALVGRSGADFTSPGYDLAATRQRFSQAGQLVGEVPIRRADGTTRIVEFAAKANILPGINFSVVRDVTERKQLEEQGLNAKQADALAALARTIAHDFNNLLSIIVCNLELALEDLAPSDPAREGLADAHRAAQEGCELARQLHAFGPRSASKPAP